MTMHKFEVGKFYKGALSGDIYECVSERNGRFWMLNRNNGTFDTCGQLNGLMCHEYVPPSKVWMSVWKHKVENNSRFICTSTNKKSYDNQYKNFKAHYALVSDTVEVEYTEKQE